MRYRCVGLAGIATLAATMLAAQAVPTSQPKVVNIYREIEKPNHSVAHEATEARWTDFNRKSGYPVTYFGLVAASGPAEEWWISSFENFESFGKSRDFEGTAAYQQGLGRIQAEDADHVTNYIAMQARGMPEVSYGAFPDLGTQRVYSIMTVRVKPGYEASFGEIAGHYKLVAEGGAGVTGWRAYEVIAGAPGGTYLVITSFPSWAALDANEAAWGRIMAAGSAHLEAAMKVAKDAIMSTEVRYFTVNPRISLVPKEMAAADPFWAPKPLATAKKATP